MTEPEQLSLSLESENPQRLPLRAFIAPELHLLTRCPLGLQQKGSWLQGPPDYPLELWPTWAGPPSYPRTRDPAADHRAGVPPYCFTGAGL